MNLIIRRLGASGLGHYLTPHGIWIWLPMTQRWMFVGTPVKQREEQAA